MSYAMWGGRYNPIVLADKLEEAKRLIEVFRIDMIIPLGNSPVVTAFPAQFSYLMRPFFSDVLFRKDGQRSGRAYVLDVHNAFVHWQNTPAWKDMEDVGIRLPVWEDTDPLRDAFLIQYGGYPDPAESGIDYAQILSQATVAINVEIRDGAPIPSEILNHPNPAFFSQHGLSRHYSIRAGWDYPGFFMGDVTNVEDLVHFWNIRAADVSLTFIDQAHWERYVNILPDLERRYRARLAHLSEYRRSPAIWARLDKLDEAMQKFGGQNVRGCPVDETIWHGGGVCPPMMIFGQASSLGVVGEGDKPKVSFSLNDKPFSGNSWFYTQHLVASMSMLGGISGSEQHTFLPPHIPELNELLGWAMHGDPDKLRSEPERIGIVIDALDHDAFLFGLSVNELIERIFGMAGVRAKLSDSGLIARQLISYLGGVDGARVFKIPGVRRLLKTHGPRASFARRAALQLIGSKDPENPGARFEDHERLFIEPRPVGTKLTAEMVFAYLVDKGLFRIGAELTCSVCHLSSWIALDTLKQKNICELCGIEYDATRQRVGRQFHYRRSGVLGLEKNIQGAVPVALALQQLSVNLMSLGRDNVYAPSYVLQPQPGVDLPECESDIIVIVPQQFPNRTQVILGECKDRGGHIDADDVRNLNRIAKALPSHRFETFILLAKLSEFTPEEIALAKTVSDNGDYGVILLSARELEPYHTYERARAQLNLDLSAGSPEAMAEATAKIYFDPPTRVGG
jgi:hypothetical protein